MSSSQIDQISATSLIEDLKSQDLRKKINAIKDLQGISFALGRERTRKELLPFLKDCIEEEEDEALIELARVLSKFIDCIGGKAYAKELFHLIEAILCVDEVNVRKEVINTFKVILSQLTLSTVENDIIDIITRLALNENSNQRISSINVIMLVFKGIEPKNKTVVINHLLAFASDESPMVKKELSASLPTICLYLEKETLMKIITIFLNDSNESIKTQIIDTLLVLEKYPSLNELIDFINDSIIKLHNDESWRVRVTVADKISQLLSFPGSNSKLKLSIIDIFSKLLEDNEAEVKNTCCLRLEQMAIKIGKEEQFDKVLAQLKKIEKNQTSFVRGALASSVLSICPIIGTKRTNEFIFPIFLELMKDENHEIRITLIKTLDKLNEVVHIDVIIQGVLPSFVEISSNKSWRIRIQVAEVIPILAKILSRKTFMDYILTICIAFLTDPVFAIRESGWKLMKSLYKTFKGDDYEKRLIDKLTEMAQNTSYLVRNTVALLIKEFAMEDDLADFIDKKLASILFGLARDPISNVRMTCAWILKRMLKLSKDKGNITQIQSLIEELKKDKDIDVVKMINSDK